MEQEFELLEEEVTDSELREILDRLGQEEFEGGELSRVADVVEATGAPSEVIGRILADIRKEDWEAKFGARQAKTEKTIDDHERRLRHQESLVSAHPPAPRRRFSASREPTPAEIHNEVERERTKRMTSRVIWLTVVVAVIGIIVFLVSTASPSAEVGDAREGRTFTAEGHEYRFRDGRWEYRPEGSQSGFLYEEAASEAAERLSRRPENLQQLYPQR